MAPKHAAMLSCGALAKMQKEEEVKEPILQVVDLKPVKDCRLRAYLWDGVEQFNYGMISSQAIPPIQDKLKPNCLIKVKTFSLTITKDRPIIILMECEVVALAEDVGDELLKPTESQKRVLAENSNSSQSNQSTPAKVPRVLSQGSPSSRMNITPIIALNPFQSRCTIRGRVTSKGDIKTWEKASSRGKLFSFEVLDDSGEIRITAFNEQCDKFYDYIEVKKVFYISGFQCKSANKQFRTTNNEYELTLGKFSNVELCTEVCDDLPEQVFSFVKISDIETMPDDQIIDVCGILKGVGDIQTINRKSDGKPFTKREAFIVDTSNKVVSLTLWNDAISKIDRTDHPVVLISKARISTFNGGLSIATSTGSSVEIDPDIDRARELRAWWKNEGERQEFESLRGSGGTSDYSAEYVDFEAMTKRGEHLSGVTDKPLYLWNRATITMFNKETSMYKACPNENCMKKAQDQGDGNYSCEKCATSGPNFKWRLVLKMAVADATKQLWCTAFNEKAEQILGVTAATLGDYSENNPDEMDKIFADAMFKQFHFKFRGRMEVYQDERRFNTAVIDVKEVKLVDDCRHLANDIGALAKFL
ncbi:replication protein A 70 kDa DNA-binding subunit [Galendromus occidentalis]|uniref:Replication protein A subunit n=1 Tax=Galendromus occidentalis TaxID=34638 RepID=A0AAJ7L3I3_9ACAR|nr:replication protein A 70 kDa DNA-binding subunit [Galendromus occidentalis]